MISKHTYQFPLWFQRSPKRPSVIAWCHPVTIATSDSKLRRNCNSYKLIAVLEKSHKDESIREANKDDIRAMPRPHHLPSLNHYHKQEVHTKPRSPHDLHTDEAFSIADRKKHTRHNIYKKVFDGMNIETSQPLATVEVFNWDTACHVASFSPIAPSWL